MMPAPNAKTILSRARSGALEGIIWAALGCVVGRFVFGIGTAQGWGTALVPVTLGAIVFAVGRGLSGQLAGAIIGGIVGAVTGAQGGDQWFGSYIVHVPVDPQSRPELEIAGPTLQGGDFDLRSLRGKVVLVDFWATWCGPCVAELPHVLDTYRKYHDRGFEVVGVSLDESHERLAAFVEKKQLPWPQIFFADREKQGWANPIARRYHVNAIPATFLIDADGRVAAADVRGTELVAAVGEMVGGSKGAGRLQSYPLGMLIGSLVGCVVGSVAGALVQRSTIRSQMLATMQSPAAPPGRINTSIKTEKTGDGVG